jgi:BirA family biotin operon repressor/biotin-[acetyl-CoA-carboxylase] ligase
MSLHSVIDRSRDLRFQLIHFETLDSTNREAADQARRGASEGVTIVAAEQTAGRGRRGRKWISRKGDGAYFSTILRPNIEPRHFPLLQLVAAVAVHDALLEWQIQPDIKWPNDILVSDKKICGILSEMVETPNGPAVVVGIGINLSNADPELNATSMETESSKPAGREDLISRVHQQLSDQYNSLLDDPTSVLREWSRRSSYLQDKDVTVELGKNDTFVGTTCGLEENGALRVRLVDGSVRIVQAGDVTRLRRV